MIAHSAGSRRRGLKQKWTGAETIRAERSPVR
jgi:hypothetical protein